MSRMISHIDQRGVAILALMMVAGMTAAVGACDTPVYRYAMYRWLPAPYEIYCFHDGQLDTEAQKVKAAVEKASEGDELRANIVFLPVDLQKDAELTSVPPDVKEAWQKRTEKSVPSYLISSPVGVHLFSGTITPPEIAALIDSPKRQETGRLMQEGKAGVYILLTGADEKANELAEQEIRGVIDDVASGKVTLYSAPPLIPSDQQADVSRPEVGFIKLARDEASEKWLTDCLLALEPDLRETKDPVVFMVYGRGRALFSCLGKGIQRDNLIQDVEFITGACSCTVKEQNPGVDLLVSYNWDAAAETLAQQYGAEEGSRYQFGGDALFPELIIPADEQMKDPAEDGSKPAESAGDNVAQVTGTAAEGGTDPVAGSNGSSAERRPAPSSPTSGPAGNKI